MCLKNPARPAGSPGPGRGQNGVSDNPVFSKEQISEPAEDPPGGRRLEGKRFHFRCATFLSKRSENSDRFSQQ